MAAAEQMRLRLIALGGTIAFGRSWDGAVPHLDGQDLLAELQNASVDVQDLASVSSIAITDEHLLGLGHAIESSIAEGYAGIVVAHGTDTLEETAYFLALTIPRGRAAIVLTGAMRHNGQLGRDGPANLQAALRVAQHPGIAEVGPVVVMADEIHAARFVTKSHTSNLSAFRSSSGPIGHVLEDRADLWFRPLYEDHLGRIPAEAIPRVELATMTIGNNAAALRAIIDTRPVGLVLAGMGGGHIPPQLLGCMDDAITQGIHVVIASRCGDGSTLRSTYAVPGTEIDLQARGAVMSGSLSGPKTRLRLAVGLANRLPAKCLFPVE